MFTISIDTHQNTSISLISNYCVMYDRTVIEMGEIHSYLHSTNDNMDAIREAIVDMLSYKYKNSILISEVNKPKKNVPYKLRSPVIEPV